MTEFSDIEDQIPRPWLPESPELVRLYEAGWREALAEKETPVQVEDAVFQSLWGRYWQGSDVTRRAFLAPMDRLYETSERTGEIKPDGASGKVPPAPLLSWAEWEYYVHTDDDARLVQVFEKLLKFHGWMESGFRRDEGFFWGFGGGRWGLAPQPSQRELPHGSVELTSFAALDAEHLANIALQIDRFEEAQSVSAKYLTLKELVNESMWDEMNSRYSDVDDLALPVGTPHIGDFWPLLANLASLERAKLTANHLRNYRAYARNHRPPNVPSTDKDFSRRGKEGLGAVWSPNAYMVARGLSRFREYELAYRIAENHLAKMAECLEETGRLWESYAPDVDGSAEAAAGDWRGWLPLAPIALLLEVLIGMRVNAPLGMVNWRIGYPGPHGVKNLRVGETTLSLKAKPEGREWMLTLAADGPVDIEVAALGAGTVIEFDDAGEKQIRFKG